MFQNPNMRSRRQPIRRKSDAAPVSLYSHLIAAHRACQQPFREAGLHELAGKREWLWEGDLGYVVVDFYSRRPYPNLKVPGAIRVRSGIGWYWQPELIPHTWRNVSRGTEIPFYPGDDWSRPVQEVLADGLRFLQDGQSVLANLPAFLETLGESNRATQVPIAILKALVGESAPARALLEDYLPWSEEHAPSEQESELALGAVHATGSRVQMFAFLSPRIEAGRAIARQMYRGSDSDSKDG